MNDNPLVDPDTGAVLHGGNFYGGHVAFAMDGLKSAVASVADLLDRQMQLLCTPATSGGLPANLVAEGRRVGNHGFKAMGITTSALTAEALKLTMPAAAFSPQHRVPQPGQGQHGHDRRARLPRASSSSRRRSRRSCCSPTARRSSCAATRRAGRARELRETVRSAVPSLVADRRQDRDIESVLALYRAGELRIDASLELAMAMRAARRPRVASRAGSVSTRRAWSSTCRSTTSTRSASSGTATIRSTSRRRAWRSCASSRSTAAT